MINNITIEKTYFGTYAVIDLSEFGGGKIKLLGISSLDELSEDNFITPYTSVNEEGTQYDDHIRGNLGDDTIKGNAGDDTIVSYAGDDELSGGTGDDTLIGGSGDDIIIGGSGDDRLYGNGLRQNGNIDSESDRDIFVYTTGSGNDTIMDFNNNEDRIDLSHVSSISDFNDISAKEVDWECSY